jgi:hypothetical protein
VTKDDETPSSEGVFSFLGPKFAAGGLASGDAARHEAPLDSRPTPDLFAAAGVGFVDPPLDFILVQFARLFGPGPVGQGGQERSRPRASLMSDRAWSVGRV